MIIHTLNYFLCTPREIIKQQKSYNNFYLVHTTHANTLCSSQGGQSSPTYFVSTGKNIAPPGIVVYSYQHIQTLSYVYNCDLQPFNNLDIPLSN